MKTKNKIPVSFVIHDPYENFPMWQMRIGFIPFGRINKFLKTVANARRNSNGCIDYISADYSNSVSAMRGENLCKNPDEPAKNYDVFSGEITLSGFFDSDYLAPDYRNYYDDEDENECYRSRCPMCVRHKNRKRSEQNKMHACATALREGKCVDLFMQKLAAMMYPDKYTKKR